MLNFLLQVLSFCANNTQKIIRRLYMQFMLDLILFFFIMMMCFIGILFLGISGALYLGVILNSSFQGFLIAGLIYVVLFLIFYIFVKVFSNR